MIKNYASRLVIWRSPIVIVLCGCLIAVIGFGARFGLAFLLMPISTAHGWGRDVFSLALAIQMLLWGAAQPFIGAIATITPMSSGMAPRSAAKMGSTGVRAI
jgi:hypothetical protein